MPQVVSAELRRVTERWRQLPLAAAGDRMPAVLTLLDELAADLGPVPDLGLAVVMDQLAVLVHDACATQPDLADALADQLADLRRAF